MEELAVFIVLLVILVAGGVIGTVVYLNLRDARPSVLKRLDPSTGQLVEVPLAPAGPKTLAEMQSELRATDPDFSFVLFEDFARRLVVRAHEARHSGAELDELSPWLKWVRDDLRDRTPKGAPVRAVTIGSIRFGPLGEGVGERRLYFTVEARLVVAAPGGDVTQWVRETWGLKRLDGSRTRPWKGARTFGCPACGAPRVPGTWVCHSCDASMNSARLDWWVRRISVDEVADHPPPLATASAEGNEPGTVFDPGYEAARDALLADDPAFTLDGLEARLRLVFAEVQRTWSTEELSGVRPFVSDGLCQQLAYRFDLHRALGLRRVVEGAVLQEATLARVVRDANLDSLTLRVRGRGRGRSYTERADSGEVVQGSFTEDRTFSEYWTLFRGAKVRGAPRADRRCPACGTEATFNPEGACTSCGALVTTGDFDWVLSRIEQDDSYAG